MKNTSSLSLFYALFILLASMFIDPTHAIIHSISAPKTVLLPREPFNITIHTSGYIQYVPQFYAVFGVAADPEADESNLGLLVHAVGPTPGADGAGFDLYKAGFSNTGTGEFNVTLRLPPGVTNGTHTLRTGVLGMAGADSGIILNYFNTTIAL